MSPVNCENLGNSVLDSTIPPGYCRMSASAGFHGPFFGSNVSRWLGAPFMYTKMTARAVFRINRSSTALAFTSPRRDSARNAARDPLAFSISRREIREQLQQFFIDRASITENEFDLIQQGPLNVGEPLLVIGCLLTHQEGQFSLCGLTSD